MIEPESLVATWPGLKLRAKGLEGYLYRPYHNLEHIGDCLKRLPELMDAAMWRLDSGDRIYREELIVATIYHDCVYNPRRSDNEEESADVAVAGHPYLDTSIIRRAVMATKHTGEPLQLIEQRILVDVDLAGLAADYGTFDKATMAIRKEYAHVDDRTFWAGRIAFLEKMLARERIYYTALYFERYEEAARRNLARSVMDCGARLAEI